MRALRLGVYSLLGLCILLLATAVLTASRADPALYPPAPGEPGIDITVADHGIHVALILPRAEVASIAGTQGLPALIAVSTRFAAYDNLEIGWGDESFYRMRIEFDRATLAAGLRALSGQNVNTVMYVSGTVGEPDEIYRSSNPMHLNLSQAGFARLLAGLDKSFDVSNGQPDVIGAGQFGANLFYRGVGQYSILNVCNHWTARLLARAGVPTTPVVDTISQFFMRDLRLRAGAKPAF